MKHLFSTLRIGWLGLLLGVAPLAQPVLAQTTNQYQILARDPEGHGLLCTYADKKILMLAGTPEQMGAAHGRLCGPAVRGVATSTMYLVGAGYSAAKGDWFFERMDDIIRRTRPHTPERFLRECDAMSRAAGISERDGRTANFFPELFHCSGVAVRHQATADGMLLHARVLDYMKDINLQKYALIQLWMPEGRNAWLSLGYAGFIGTVTCMNEQGLAIGEMGGRGENKWDGVPMNFLLRDIMERAGTVREALAILSKTPRTCEYYYVLSDRTRDMVAVRATPEQCEILEAGQQHPQLPPVPTNTVFISAGQRAATLSERLRAAYGRLDVPRMIELIKRPVAMTSNLHNAIFRPETLDMWCADAGRKNLACDQPYVRINLTDLLAFYRHPPAAPPSAADSTATK